MARKTVEVLECDRCGNEGESYKVQFPDGETREFILCDKHNAQLVKLRELPYGTWVSAKKRRAFKKVDLPAQ